MRDMRGWFTERRNLDGFVDLAMVETFANIMITNYRDSEK